MQQQTGGGSVQTFQVKSIAAATLALSIVFAAAPARVAAAVTAGWTGDTLVQSVQYDRGSTANEGRHFYGRRHFAGRPPFYARPRYAGASRFYGPGRGYSSRLRYER
jgi:hypothetical protein